MKNFFRNTPSGKAGTIDGLNLFFGALLGANLGTLQGLALPAYVQLIILLAGTVVVLRLLSTSDNRPLVFGTLAFYVLLIGSILLLPRLHPKGMALEDLQRLVATLAIWVACILSVELSPVRATEPK
jgi:hypothetical protein